VARLLALRDYLSSILQVLTWVAGHHSDRSSLCCQPLVQLTHKQQVAQLALGLRSDMNGVSTVLQLWPPDLHHTH
jgi:hypothetical protein